MRFSLVILLLFLLNTSYSQLPNYYDKLNIDLLFALHNDQLHDLPDTLALIVEGQPSGVMTQTRKYNGNYITHSGTINTLFLPKSKLIDFVNEDNILRVEYSDTKPVLLQDSMHFRNNTDSLIYNKGVFDDSLSGEGVLIGIIDLPIVDYKRTDFNDPNTGKTRFFSIWNQTASYDGINSQGYGHIYEASDVNFDTLDLPITSGHATNVAGHAAGNGASSEYNFRGVANKSNIISVHVGSTGGFNFNMMNAIKYIFDEADKRGMPCVINSSVGTYTYQTRDGRESYSRFVDSLILAKNGRMVVQAFGNNGNKAIHVRHITQPDTSITWYNYLSKYAPYTQIRLHADTNKLSNKTNIQWNLVNKKGTNTVVASSPMFNLDTSIHKTDNSGYALRYLTINTDTLASINIYTIKQEGRYDIYHKLNLLNGTKDIYEWELRTWGEESIFDSWSNSSINTANIFPTSSLPDSTIYPLTSNHYERDLKMNSVGGIACANIAISAGGYVNQNSWIDYNNNTQTTNDVVGQLWYRSSHGPTRDNRTAPNITTSGSMNTFVLTPTNNTNYLTSPNTYLKGGTHARWWGTSFSAPIVTGSIALYLEQYPNASATQIREDMFATAKQDSFTLQSAHGGYMPNDYWGHGKLNAYQFLKRPATYSCKQSIALNYDESGTISDSTLCIFESGCTDKQAVNYSEHAITDDNSGLYSTVKYQDGVALFISPNPFQDHTTIYLKSEDFAESGKIEYEIYSSLGQKIVADDLGLPQDSRVINTSDLQTGIFFLKALKDGKEINTQLIRKL